MLHKVLNAFDIRIELVRFFLKLSKNLIEFHFFNISVFFIEINTFLMSCKYSIRLLQTNANFNFFKFYQKILGFFIISIVFSIKILSKKIQISGDFAYIL